MPPIIPSPPALINAASSLHSFGNIAPTALGMLPHTLAKTIREQHAAPITPRTAAAMLQHSSGETMREQVVDAAPTETPLTLVPIETHDATAMLHHSSGDTMHELSADAVPIEAPLMVDAAPIATPDSMVSSEIESWLEPIDDWHIGNVLQVVQNVPATDQNFEKKEEDVKKEEEHLQPTVVTVYVPLFDEPLFTAPPRPLKLGEVPPNYATVNDRKELLATLVRRFSAGNNELRFDLVTRSTKRFIDGEINGLFEECVPFLSGVHRAFSVLLTVFRCGYYACAAI